MAAVKYAVKVKGFSEIQRALRKIEDGSYEEFRSKIRKVGEQVALVAAANAPRDTGVLQQSITNRVLPGRASIYSTAVYGGAVNYGAWTKQGRGPHIKRANASHYMTRATEELAPWVAEEMDSVLDWAITTFQEG